MDKRTFLAIALSLILVLAYQYFFIEPPVPGDVAEEQNGSEVLVTGTERQQPARQPSAAAMPDDIGQAPAFSADETEGGREVRVSGPLYTAVLSTRGAGIVSFKLEQYRQTLDDDSGLIELVNVRDGMPYPLTVTFPDSGMDIPAWAVYKADRESVDLDRGESESIVFTKTYPGRMTVEKVYTFYRDSYAFDFEIRVRNLSEETVTQTAGILWSDYLDPDVRVDRFSHVGPVAYVGDDLVTENPKKLNETKYYGPGVLWAGYQTKYFIASVISQQPSLTSAVVAKSSSNDVFVSLRGPRVMIPPGESGTFRYNCYLGPKEYDILKSLQVNLESSIDFGSWIKWLALPLLKALKLINGFVHNYGLAIIILTIFVKVIFWPLGTMSYKSMKNMQKIQPEMQKLREKYKDDKAKMQEETMSLYRAYKVNPLGGCLPILIQIPVFFGLYRALLYSIELRHSPFFFWIQDLSAKDPYYITPIIMGASMYLQQKMMPTPSTNELQAKIMTWMPVAFTFLFLNFPAGLVLYWLFNNIISVGQQYWINKRTK